MSTRIVSPIITPTNQQTQVNPDMANFILMIHATLIILIPIMAILAPPSYAWISTAIVLGFFANWEYDKERKCSLTRLENKFRGIPEEKAGPGFMYEKIGRVYFPAIEKTQFYRLLHLTYLIFAFIGLARYVNKCISCSVKKGILKGKRRQ